MATYIEYELEDGSTVLVAIEAEESGLVPASRTGDAIKKATDDLAEILQQVGSAAYQQQPQDAGPAAEETESQSSEGKSDDEDVVDGEFKQV